MYTPPVMFYEIWVSGKFYRRYTSASETLRVERTLRAKHGDDAVSTRFIPVKAVA